LAAVHELDESVDWLKSRLGLERHVFACDQIYLHRVQLLAEERVQQRLVSRDSDVQVQELHRLKLVKFPREILIWSSLEEHRRQIEVISFFPGLFLSLSIDLPNRNIHLEIFKVSGNIFAYFCRWPILSSKIFDQLNLSWPIVRYLFKSRGGSFGTALSRRRLAFGSGLWVLWRSLNRFLALNLDESPLFEEASIDRLLFYLLACSISRRSSKLEPIKLDFEVVSALVLGIKGDSEIDVVHRNCGVIFLDLHIQ